MLSTTYIRISIQIVGLAIDIEHCCCTKNPTKRDSFIESGSPKYTERVIKARIMAAF